MKKNMVLSISAALLQVARIAVAILAAILLVMFIGSFVNESLELSEFAKSVSVLDSASSHIIYTLSEDNFWISVYVIFQKLLILIAWFQILGFGRDIVINIKSIKTFAKDNVKAFRKISRLAIWLLILHFIALSPEEIGLSIEFNYLLFAFAAIILTQVFKEGQKLLEENELTV